MSAEGVEQVGGHVPLDQRWNGPWKAGPIAPCDGSTEGFFRSVHIVAVCLCGAAFVSTDGTIAVRMAVEHEQSHAASSSPAPSSPLGTPEATK